MEDYFKYFSKTFDLILKYERKFLKIYFNKEEKEKLQIDWNIIKSINSNLQPLNININTTLDLYFYIN